jgi:hypothetical protein
MDPFAFNPKIPQAPDHRFDLFHGLPLGPAMASYAENLRASQNR